MSNPWADMTDLPEGVRGAEAHFPNYRGHDYSRLTVERFAALQSCWPDSIQCSGGVLLFRVHPKHNRPTGDETVLARAVVWFPTDQFGDAELRRLTIRAHSIDPSGSWKADSRRDDHDISEYFRLMYLDMLMAVMRLPVVELPTGD